MVPNADAWGFMFSARTNLVIVMVTIAAWLLSNERKFLKLDLLTLTILAFLGWITINGFFAIDPDLSWPLWNKVWKTIALGLFVSVMATSKVRIQALVWVLAVSVMYYSIKGGLFTILTGGYSHVLGPVGSQIWDANTLALATLMVLPLVNYLRLQTKSLLLARGLLAAITLSTVSVLGSYSRGAFIALGGLGGMALLRSKRKLLYVVSATFLVVPLLFFMPQAYFSRIGTIQTAGQDSSFHGRLVAWQVALNYASSHFPLGAGIDGPGLIFGNYFPDEKSHAAHSIFFEVLGDNGFIGLVLYLVILVVAFIYCVRIKRVTRGKDEFTWAFDLANMIQLSLFVFCLGGAALSMAYYDTPYICLGLLSATLRIVRDIPSLNGQVLAKFKASVPFAASSSLQPTER
jgi:probable O-glycosylation ligase (exosortase A-associated)